MNMKEKYILISLIVPIYNVEQYLRRCVDSLINQTYHNLEIILVDDGSPDRCGEICDEYAKKDSRVVVVHKPNGGLSDARNKGLDVATGDFVMFIDSDDWIELNTCEIVQNIICDNRVDLVVFARNNVYDNGKIIKSKTHGSRIISTSKCLKSLVYRVIENGIFNSSCNKCYLRMLLSDLRFPVGKLAEDQGFTYKAIHRANKIFVSDAHLYNYFQRSGSISHREFTVKLREDEYEMWIDRLSFIKDHYPELVDYQIGQILGDMYICKILIKKNNESRELYKTIDSFIKEYGKEAKHYASYNRRVKLHYYCYPLFWIYVKLKLK